MTVSYSRSDYGLESKGDDNPGAERNSRKWISMGAAIGAVQVEARVRPPRWCRPCSFSLPDRARFFLFSCKDFAAFVCG